MAKLCGGSMCGGGTLRSVACGGGGGGCDRPITGIADGIALCEEPVSTVRKMGACVICGRPAARFTIIFGGPMGSLCLSPKTIISEQRTRAH